MFSFPPSAINVKLVELNDTEVGELMEPLVVIFSISTSFLSVENEIAFEVVRFTTKYITISIGMVAKQIPRIAHEDSLRTCTVGDIDGNEDGITDGAADGVAVVGYFVGLIVGITVGLLDGKGVCPQWPIIVCSASSNKASLKVSLKNEQTLVSAENSNAIQWKSLMHPSSQFGKVASVISNGISVKTRLYSLVQDSKQ